MIDEQHAEIRENQNNKDTARKIDEMYEIMLLIYNAIPPKRKEQGEVKQQTEETERPTGDRSETVADVAPQKNRKADRE